MEVITMQEKIIGTKKNGMAMMLLLIATILAATAGFVGSVFLIEGNSPAIGTVLLILCIIVFVAALICLGGLKVLKPQEALVLTLFGNYLGTLKGEGFYWVHPFATAVNPAATTVLNQSGDVKTGAAPAAVTNMKMSLKIMTLSNNCFVDRRKSDDRYVACCGHRQGSLQCGQLQGIFVFAVRQCSA